MEEYFVPLLNGDEIMEARGDVRRERIGESDGVVREVVREEIMGTLKKIKGGKAAGMEWYCGRNVKKGRY